MIVKLQTEHHSEFLSLKGGCRGWSEYTLVKMSNCWKSHATAQFSCFSQIVLKNKGEARTERNNVSWLLLNKFNEILP